MYNYGRFMQTFEFEIIIIQQLIKCTKTRQIAVEQRLTYAIELHGAGP